MDEKIAIIGMAGSFPDAANYNIFWENLCSGVVTSGIIDASFDDYISVKAGIFDPEGFNPQKYNISEKEAEIMDPQLRKFIELVDSALIDANYPQGKGLAKVSVIASQGTNHTYHDEITKWVARGELPPLNQFQENINRGADFLASRVAHVFDFHGPCFNLQSACSSSLTSVVEAYWMLQSGRCEAVICGGITISWPLQGRYKYEAGSIYSRTGVCRPFDAQADGTLPAGGGGVIILKRLSNALRDGDRIHAVISGALSNNDGAQKLSYAAPSVSGQYRLLSDLYQRQNINPRELQFIECHATGTAVGDPMEVKSIMQLMKDYEPRVDLPAVLLGSVKGNIGHLFWASGIASLIKSVLSIKYGEYPAVAGIGTINPLLEMGNKSQISICTQNTALRECDNILAGVSSMGVGGTNAHVIIERFHEDWQPPPSSHYEKSPEVQDRYSLLPLLEKHTSPNTMAMPESQEKRSGDMLQQIIAIWSEALGEKNLTPESDYFDSYGDSVTAIQIIAEIKRLFQVEISSDTLYHYTTVRALTGHIRERIREKQSDKPPLQMLFRVSTKAEFNTFQTRFYLLEKLQRTAFSHYNVPLCLTISDQFPQDVFRKALQEVVSFLPLFYLQCRLTSHGLETGERREKLIHEEHVTIPEGMEPEALFSSLMGQSFNLEQGEVCRLSYVSWEEKRYLVINFPHLFIDGSGLDNLLSAVEDVIANGTPLASKFISSTNSYTVSDKSREWWKRRLTDRPVTRLPPTYKATQAGKVLPGSLQERLPQQLVERVLKVSRKFKTSPFIVWYSTFNAHLAHVLSETTLCTGITIANRDPEDKKAIGCYINNLPILVTCGQTGIRNMLQETAQSLQDSLTHANVPLNMISADACRAGESLYDILFMYQNQNQGYQINVNGQTYKESSIRYQPVYTPLCVNLIPIGKNLEVDVSFNETLYSYDYIATFIEGWLSAADNAINELEND